MHLLTVMGSLRGGRTTDTLVDGAVEGAVHPHPSGACGYFRDEFYYIACSDHLALR